MYTYKKENVKIKEYCSKIYYPFYFNGSEYKSLIKKYKDSKKWTNLDEEEITNRKNELLPDVANYLFSNCNDNSNNSVCIFKMKIENELINNSLEDEDILRNLKKFKLIDGNQTIIFGIENIELFLFGDGIGILTFEIELGDGTNSVTSPSRILNFNKMFKLNSSGKNNVIFNKLDGSKIETNFKKIIDKIMSEMINESIIPFYERGFINLRYVRFEKYQTCDEFKNSTFGFMYYLMNMFNESDIIEIPDDFAQSQVYMPQGNIAHFFTLKGGGIFVYENGSKFINNNGFKKNVMENYSIGLLLALHQRIAMLKISKELTNVFLDNKISSNQNNKKKNKMMLVQTEKILDKFRSFTAKYWFREFSNIEGRNNFFKDWQKCFGLECLFQEMRDKIQDINEYLRFIDYKQAEESRDNQNYIITVITLIFMPLNFFVGFMGMNIGFLNIEKMNFNTTIIYLGAITFICWIIIAIVYGIKKIKDNIMKN